MPRALLPLVLAFAVLTAACGSDPVIHDWQRPHDTYQVGAFTKSQNAEELKDKLGRSGFAARIQTEIQNGVFYLNVLVDIYSPVPGVEEKLERISGTKPILRSKARVDAPAAPAG
ncbi:SPOR domain-containing protein [Desulfolutivibrio sulfoxidireducens]|uniref:SPOR domain-containing protein n=1 Tax=Desulfolutivibrio sulfoxidireducens TaxID=2773299 RepID=UPI00159EA31E|nr:SPOR domain-containing protein [Desulfolutivibrio sulfoxidireducens]QLA15190.1 SPOR domain-containing protein [Desulfolutivibrio sulfoxidireducens]QLA18761.1 SPOR domain-containing protein [Desulfolutivibrio sulfoxidireducens]